MMARFLVVPWRLLLFASATAGVLGKALEQLLAWAEENGGKRPQQKDPLP